MCDSFSHSSSGSTFQLANLVLLLKVVLLPNKLFLPLLLLPTTTTTTTTNGTQEQIMPKAYKTKKERKQIIAVVPKSKTRPEPMHAVAPTRSATKAERKSQNGIGGCDWRHNGGGWSLLLTRPLFPVGMVVLSAVPSVL